MTKFCKLKVTTQVLDFGSPFQGGLVFSINADATKIKVLANITLANAMNAGWVTPAFSPYLPPEANDFYDGRGNTAAMVDFYAYGTFAALSCANYEVGADNSTPCSDEDDIPCYRDWYLPAICELAPDPIICPIPIDNVYANLYLAGNNNLQTTPRWSSTIVDPNTLPAQIYAATFSVPVPNGLLTPFPADQGAVVRCVRLFEHI